MGSVLGVIGGIIGVVIAITLWLWLREASGGAWVRFSQRRDPPRIRMNETSEHFQKRLAAYDRYVNRRRK